MSKKKTPKETPATAVPAVAVQRGFWSYLKWILPAFGFLLYANTLGHDYTQDDAIVIYDNMYTVKGLAGIPGLLSKDTFHGFFKEEGKAKLVSGGRYRPLTPVMFAIEYQLFGKNPFIGHLINALLYGLLGWMIYLLLVEIFGFRTDFSDHFRYVVLAAAVLFLAHPVHTEAVANIKGRDEIVSMLGAITATWLILRQAANKGKYFLWALLSFFLALMSKENAITFLAVVPLILVFFYNKGWGDALRLSLPLLAGAVIFMLIRTAVLGFDLGGTPMELMNNPFLKLGSNGYIPFSAGEKFATILYTLGKYLMLLLVPHPLTHDYYPRHIDIMHFGDAAVLVSLLTYVALIGLAVYGYKKDRVLSFGILYFLLTLSIVSNIVFPIGTNMSERFLFMPSLGFCLILPYIIYKISKKGRVAFYATAVLALAFSIKTISRNAVWVNDFTLFTTDVKTSARSAKVLNAAGGALQTEAANEKDVSKKNQMLQQAIVYLNEAVKIHPGYKNAYLLMGNSYYYLNDFDKSIEAYKKSLQLDPDFKDAINNLAVVYRDAGRNAGEKQNNIVLAEQMLLESFRLNPNDAETNRLLGIAYGLSGRHSQAIPYFEKVTQLDPKNAAAFMNLSSAYRYNGDEANAAKYRNIALSLDPKLGQGK